MLTYIHIPSPGIFIYQDVISQKLSLKYIYHLWQQRAHKVPGQEHSLQKNEIFFLTSKMFFLPEKGKQKVFLSVNTEEYSKDSQRGSKSHHTHVKM